MKNEVRSKKLEVRSILLKILLLLISSMNFSIIIRKLFHFISRWIHKNSHFSLLTSHFLLLTFALFILTFPLSSHAVQPLFGSHETRFDTFDLFPKWVGVLTRHKNDTVAANSACEAPMQTPCIFLRWRIFLNTLKDKTPMQQLNAVNRNMNTHKYITDIANWGMTDYWETPKEFFLKDGDCEDFAIAKFKSLMYLGFKNEDMRIVVLQDLNLQVAHAVLAVYINGKPYILDNQAEQVIPADKIKHYMPIYSINETNWWRHS